MKAIAMLTLATALAAGPAVAQAPAADAHNQHHGSEASKADFSSAEVRRVDKDTQKVTLRHGPIPNLGMGDMQMVFRVTDPRMLDDLKPGDRIRFKADKVGGQYTVTELEIAR
jgi:Cu/Ag efflux protein CusF